MRRQRVSFVRFAVPRLRLLLSPASILSFKTEKRTVVNSQGYLALQFGEPRIEKGNKIGKLVHDFSLAHSLEDCALQLLCLDQKLSQEVRLVSRSLKLFFEQPNFFLALSFGDASQKLHPNFDEGLLMAFCQFDGVQLGSKKCANHFQF
jgi:hypothetical protein